MNDRMFSMHDGFIIVFDLDVGGLLGENAD